MTFLLWIRTKRRLSTYDDDDLEKLMKFEGRLRRPGHYGSVDVREPIEGGDQLLYPIESLARIHDVGLALSTVMDDYLVDDWCLTEVGNALAPLPPEDEYQTIPEGYAFAVPEMDFGGLNWNMAGIPSHYQTGATGLWVDFTSDLHESQRLIKQLEGKLPKPTKRMWSGRSSILFAYQSDQTPSSSTYLGLSESLREIIGSDNVAMWLAFQIGNWSVGGAMGELGEMADFIRKLPSKRVA